jgi:hypothetical protein
MRLLGKSREIVSVFIGASRKITFLTIMLQNNLKTMGAHIKRKDLIV